MAALSNNFKRKLSQQARDFELRELIRNPNFFTVASRNPKVKSRILDSLIFPNKAEIEKSLVKNFEKFTEVNYREVDVFQYSQPWIGLDPQNLETTYSDFASLFIFLKQQNNQIKKIVDIGSAYGRAGVVSQSIYPDSNFVGYEMVKERVVESNSAFKRLGLNKAISYNQNIMLNSFDSADLFIVFDFSHMPDLIEFFYNLFESKGNENFLIAAIGENTPKVLLKCFPNLSVIGRPQTKSGWFLFKNIS